MTTQRLQVAVIVGSTREGRFAPTVRDWFVSVAGQRDDLAVDVIDLAGAGGERPEILDSPAAPAIGSITPRIAAAGAYVVITPEYNHSFPGDLKQAIDWHREEWQAKPVGFVSYGGVAGGLRAVEQLRLVFAELHAPTMRDTVSFHGVWQRFGPDGRPHDEAGPAGAAKVLLDQLTWWGVTLRDTKAARPYAA
ncbi:NAD(P)H-dependent oxidoreductase [Streptomyces sp. NPDC050844]|uniref:NADPH-dependent FMN reductase n=1 Tax=Streptomyces sp. NPDC050844 TaxID=3155790 RepID=UPI0033FB2FAD